MTKHFLKYIEMSRIYQKNQSFNVYFFLLFSTSLVIHDARGLRGVFESRKITKFADLKMPVSGIRAWTVVEC